MPLSRSAQYLLRLHSCLAVVGLGLAGPALAQDMQASIHGEATGPAYANATSIWPGGGLAAAAEARVGVPASRALRPVDGQALAQLRAGMSMDEVAAQAGQPLARGGNRRWDYLVADSQGLYVASIWFNNEQRLWMGKASNPPSAEAFAILSARPAPLPLARPLTLSASRLFEFGSAELRADQPELDGLVRAFASGSAGQRLVVTGHTDALGAPALNDALSLRRAEAVRSYLIARGVPAEAVTAQGRGSAEPVASCQGAAPRAALIACLAPNRRVVIESAPAL